MQRLAWDLKEKARIFRLITGNQSEASGKKKLCFTKPELVCKQKEVPGGKKPRTYVVQQIMKTLE